MDQAKTLINKKAQSCAHLSNINVDPMLTGSLKHVLDFGASHQTGKKLIIGSSEKCDIQIYGIGVNERHAAITINKSEFYLEPFANSRVIKNGKLYDEKFLLKNFDRLVFGASLYYLFVDPTRFEQQDTNTVMAKINNYTADKVE